MKAHETVIRIVELLGMARWLCEAYPKTSWAKVTIIPGCEFTNGGLLPEPAAWTVVYFDVMQPCRPEETFALRHPGNGRVERPLTASFIVRDDEIGLDNIARLIEERGRECLKSMQAVALGQTQPVPVPSDAPVVVTREGWK